MSEFKLEAKKREGKGKNKVDKMRVEKLVPGVVYSKGSEPQIIVVNEKDFNKIYLDAGTSNIIDLNIEGANQPALIKEVQRHPFKNQYIHADFQGVDMSVKMKVLIPVVLEGRDSIRVQPSILMQLINEIEVECLPADLPSEAVIKVEEMQIGDNVTVKDFDIFGNTKIEVLIDAEEVVATLSEPREEVIEEEIGEVSAEVPTVEETEAATEE